MSVVDHARPDAGDIRPGEVAVEMPDHNDAGLVFIGRIRTPWPTRRECPRRGDRDAGPLCRLEIDARWRPALKGIAQHTHLQVLYFMHLARRDLVLQSPRSDSATTGTFALRSPVRPNPIAISLVALVEVGPDHLVVRGLDCVDGTPLIDIKPESCPEWPQPKA